MAAEKRKPNRLMQVLVAASVGIHAVIFAHIAGIYKSDALSYIELSLQDVSKPAARSIPRPRLRPRTPKVQNPTALRVQPQVVPQIKVAPMDVSAPEGLMESISAPDVGATAPVAAADWGTTDIAAFATRKDYFEMVRMRIESRKQYPLSAKARQIEGRVVVRFSITPDGQVSSVQVVGESRYDIFNGAALQAVQDAAPFPAPPRHLFKEALQLELSIMFELT